jgi:hypothetical protein
VAQSQQDVFSTDVAVVEEPGFFLCQDDHASGAIREALEQVLAPVSLVPQESILGLGLWVDVSPTSVWE